LFYTALIIVPNPTESEYRIQEPCPLIHKVAIVDLEDKTMGCLSGSIGVDGCDLDAAFGDYIGALSLG